jgi:hypothetical protein
MMVRTNRVAHGIMLGLVGLALVVGGCATTSEVPPQAVSQLLGMRNELIDGKAQIQKTTGAAKDLVDNPRQDIQPQVNAFRTQVTQLSKDALQTRQAAASAQARAEDFFANWEKQLQTMSGSLAEGGQQRRTESMASFQQLRDRLTGVRTQFQPVLADLQEAERYLGTDPTAAGLKVAAPTIKKALGREPAVLKSIDELIAQIDVVRGGK